MGLKQLNNNNGFSLISIIVAAAVGMIVVGAISKVIISQSEQVAYLEDRLSKTNLKGTLQNLLTPLACQNTFRGQSVPSSPRRITELRDTNDNIVYQIPLPGGGLPDFEKLEIARMELHNIDLPSAADASGRMKFVVFTERIRSKGAKLNPIEIDLDVATDSSSLINDCSQSGGPLTLNPGEMPCILPITTNTGGAPPPPGAPGLASRMKANYTDNLEIFPHGQRDIVDHSFEPYSSYCWGKVERVFRDTYRCNNKQLIRTSHTYTGDNVYVSYDLSGCGP